jgi:Fe-S-cluster containining protein
MLSDAQNNCPWYAAGLAFECSGCGGCCAGPEEGYVWATETEIAAIADFLGITEKQMYRDHARKVGRRFSLREVKKTKDCIFLKPDGHGGRGCSIYPVRPTQCRTWPFWPMNLRTPEDWSLAGLRCPGINRGPRFDIEAIEVRRQKSDV